MRRPEGDSSLAICPDGSVKADSGSFSGVLPRARLRGRRLRYDGTGGYAGLYAYPDGERSLCLLWNFLPGLTGEVDPVNLAEPSALARDAARLGVGTRGEGGRRQSGYPSFGYTPWLAPGGNP